MRVLVTGGAGYIGSVMVRELLRRGYEVTVLDLLLFGDRGISDIIGEKGFRLINADVRNYDPNIVSGYDVVIDLAAISQPDPTGRISEDMFHEINYLSAVRTAQISSKRNVGKYLYASTCSVYGFQNKVVDETSTPNPLESYAKSKHLAEMEIAKTRNICKTVLRLATVYGYSPKIRFDLVVNAMTLTLYKYGKVMVGNPGTQMRPVVHVMDVVEAFLKVLEAEREVVDSEIFNVGSNEQNYQVIDLAREVFRALNKEPKIEFYGEPDSRSYIVDFTKISRCLGFRCKYRVADGVKEIFKALKDGTITDEPWTKVIDWWHTLVNRGTVTRLGTGV